MPSRISQVRFEKIRLYARSYYYLVEVKKPFAKNSQLKYINPNTKNKKIIKKT